MGKQFYTYLHCKPTGEPFYVGKGCGERSHDFYQRNRFHKFVVAKYGRENIGVFVFPCADEQEAFDNEIHQIAQLRADGFMLVNFTNGGEGSSGYVHTLEAREKIGKATVWLGRKHSESSRKKMSESRKGMILSTETKLKIAQGNKGRQWTGEQRLTISIAKKSRHMHHTPEALAKISAAGKGRTPWNLGKKQHENSKKAMAKSWTPDRKEKMKSADYREKMSLSLKAYWASKPQAPKLVLTH